MNKQTILVEIDALTDTRLGTLMVHAPETIPTIMDNGYWDRISDDFEELSEGKIKNAEYATWYKERTWEALTKSMLTNCVHVLAEMLLELQRKQVESVTVGKIETVINVWPYELAENVKSDLAAAISTKLPPAVDVSVVSYSHDQLNPSFIEKRYDGLIMYNFDDWYSINGPRLLEKQIPTTTFYVPQMIRPGMKIDNPIYKGEEGIVDPFKYMRISEYGKYIIEFLPPIVFSVLKPR